MGSSPDQSNHSFQPMLCDGWFAASLIQRTQPRAFGSKPFFRSCDRSNQRPVRCSINALLPSEELKRICLFLPSPCGENDELSGGLVWRSYRLRTEWPCMLPRDMFKRRVRLHQGEQVTQIKISLLPRNA